MSLIYPKGVSPLKIDIGCGSNKEAGYLGIDRIAGPVVDIVCDICQEIPLPDNSAEFVMASRVLPYVDNLFAAMAEIHRISIHKAVVCILAPYAHSFAHMSNPSFKQKFDEYTPGILQDPSSNPHPVQYAQLFQTTLYPHHPSIIGCCGWSYSINTLMKIRFTKLKN